MCQTVKPLGKVPTVYYLVEFGNMFHPFHAGHGAIWVTDLFIVSQHVLKLFGYGQHKCVNLFAWKHNNQLSLIRANLPLSCSGWWSFYPGCKRSPRAYGAGSSETLDK